jgi:polyketide biosynthesis 3-hydroxy-3-methylglutaryl-CoA synthase-like enzyme PksG
VPGEASRSASASLAQQLASRYNLSMAEYDRILDQAGAMPFGIQDLEVDLSAYRRIYDTQFAGQGLLVLEGIRNYHREYRWS